MTEDQDFSQHPKSITEMRAEREEDAKIWTPRDALISALRDLDEGTIQTDTLLVMWKHDNNGWAGNFAYKNKDNVIAMVSRVLRWLVA